MVGTQCSLIFRSSLQHEPYKNKVKNKAILVTGRGGLQGCEKSRILHFLDNRLTDGSVVVSLTRRSLFTRTIPGTHFCQRLSRGAARRIRSIEKIIRNLVGNRTRDLPACSIVLQPTTLQRAEL
jgi:hypothetical protein